MNSSKAHTHKYKCAAAGYRWNNDIRPTAVNTTYLIETPPHEKKHIFFSLFLFVCIALWNRI